MLLSDKTIKEYLASGKLGITPIDLEEQLQPASVDLKLGNTFAYIKSEKIEFDKEVEYELVEANEIWIQPLEFVLGTTREYITLPNDITGFVDGRSSVGRTGLFIHNAGLIDAGFEGEITLEFFNAGPAPIKLVAGHRICQIDFDQMDQEAENPYQGKYQGQRKATGSRINLDYLIKKGR